MSLEALNRVRLSWVHCGARQATLEGRIHSILPLIGIELTEDEKKDFKTSITKLSKVAEFSNAVFRREYIRDLPDQGGGNSTRNVQTVNASYLPRFEATIARLKKRYFGRIVGRILDCQCEKVY